MSTFHGLEMAKQALFTQQSALYTTGHNISNANTKGYSRQRVNFETMNPYPSASRNRPQIPGQIGTGVQVGSVQRVRNEFLDIQFRGENSKAGYYEAKSEALARMEGILNEPSDSGLSKTMDKFWQSLQDLSVNPKDSGGRSVVLQRGIAVADTFKYLSKSLNSIRGDLQSQIENKGLDVNSLLKQINEVNAQVKQLEPHGYLANDLYDERDRLIDELSSIINIDVTYNNEHSPTDMAKGVATIKIQDNNGNSSLTLVDGLTGKYNEVKIGFSGEGEEKGVSSIKVGDDNLQIMKSNGSLKGLIEAYGHTLNGDGLEGEYPQMISELNELAYAFAKSFNEVHRGGYGVDGTTTGLDFFNDFPADDKKGAAGKIEVVLEDPASIAASEDDTVGNGENALKLSDVFNKSNDYLDGNPSVNGFYESLVGKMGVEAQEANRMTDNSYILRAQVDNQRMSVSAVSLDEEMTNMIKFQHAYNAAARSMTVVDEMINRIINNMGIVGR